MFQTFEAILENGHIQFQDETVNPLPAKARVLITVVETIESSASDASSMARFAGVWADLSVDEKKVIDHDLQILRDSWERPI